MRHWYALVIINDIEKKKMHTSFLTFSAQNRFYAGKAIEGMLPGNPELLDDAGNLLPYSVFELAQCKPEDVEEVLEDVMAKFQLFMQMRSSGLL